MSRAFAFLSLLVGLGLFVGFGWLAIDAGLDTSAFPAAPKSMNVAELALLREVPRGTWVELVGACEFEAEPVQPNAGGPFYMLVRDPQRTARVVVTSEYQPDPVCPPKVPWTGVPSVHRTSSGGAARQPLPHGLAFRGVDWSRPSEPPVVILWTHSGPKNSRMGLVLSPLFALVGILVTASALANFRRPVKTMDAVWTADALPQSVRLGPLAGRRLRIYAWVMTGFGLAWLLAFGALEVIKGRFGVPSVFLLGVGTVILFMGIVLWLHARRVSGHEYFATLVWLPVRKSYAVRSEGIATGVLAYELDMPGGMTPSLLTAHSGPLHGGLVFRDASRGEVLAARPLHSSDVVVLTSSLREIRENPLAPLSHPRHRLKLLP